jgi:hypothetical protein
MQIMNYVSQALDEENYCIAVFLDLKKAFDVCNHEILLKNYLKWMSVLNTTVKFLSCVRGTKHILKVY